MSEAITNDDLKSRERLLAELQMMRLSCSRLVDQVMELQKAEARVAELESALKRVMVGGNHLALIIGNHPPVGTETDIVMKHYLPHHPHMYEAWCCWNEIMQARNVLERIAAPHGGQPVCQTHSQECPTVERGEAATLSDERLDKWRWRFHREFDHEYQGCAAEINDLIDQAKEANRLRTENERIVNHAKTLAAERDELRRRLAEKDSQ